MEDKELFNQVLDADEEIIRTIRPVKARAWFGVIVSVVLMSIFFIPMIIGMICSPEDGSLGGLIAFIAIYVLLALISIICVALWNKKTVYAITNKRVLIRTGYIGVDYKSLDYSMIGAFTVNVSWVDKLLKKNTGTISFGSTASPMVNSNVSRFVFSFVDKPYETYKEIKSYIDERKKNN